MSENSRQLIQSLRGNIQKVSQYIKQIESIEQKIGTPRDSHELRSSLVKIQNDSKNLISVCQANLKQLHSMNDCKTVTRFILLVIFLKFTQLLNLINFDSEIETAG